MQSWPEFIEALTKLFGGPVLGIRYLTEEREKKKDPEAPPREFAYLLKQVTSYTFLLILAALNLFLIYPLFLKQASEYLIATPFLPVVSKLVADFTGMSLPLAYEVLVGVFYILGILSFYGFVRILTGRELTAVIAATCYSLFSPATYFFSGLPEALPEYGSIPMRLKALIVFSEGPHVASLAVIPVCAILFLAFLKFGTFRLLFLTTLSLVVLGMISRFGIFAFLYIACIIWLSEVFLGEARKKTARMAMALFLALGLSSFWYDQSLPWNLLSFAAREGVTRNLVDLIPIGFVTVPVLGTFFFLLFEHRPQLQHLFIVSALVLGFFFLISTWIVLNEVFAPQPWRFLIEFDFAFSLLVGFALSGVFEIFWRIEEQLIGEKKLPAFLQGVFPMIFLGLMVLGTGAFIVSEGHRFQDISSYGIGGIDSFLKEEAPILSVTYLQRDVLRWVYGSELESLLPFSFPSGYNVLGIVLGVLSLTWLVEAKVKFRRKLFKTPTGVIESQV
ncbi:MAG TPA: hypothetical protein VJB91_01095 [Patescibacteria group bacterium]|nr:hypothetical protein [Patescibacteria group bacterium]